MAMGLPGAVSEDGCSMLAQESVEWLEKNNYDEYTWYLNNFHVNIITGKKLDYKNETYTIGELKRNPSDEKSIIIWDSYFAPTDSEVSLELVESWDVKFLQEFNGTYKDMPYSIRVYELLNNNYIGRKNTDQ
jgi:hypothetical protein